MKTETLKPEDIKENEELITDFAETLKKHCTGKHDVWYAIRAIRDCMEFMTDQRFEQNSDLFHVANCIRKNIIGKDHGIFVSQFEKMASISSEVLILANQFHKGIEIVDNMSPDLDTLLS